MLRLHYTLERIVRSCLRRQYGKPLVLWRWKNPREHLTVLLLLLY